MRKKQLKSGGSDKDEAYIDKPLRRYIKSAIKAGTHPVRSSILKSLKDDPKTTIELEEITGESRYNLYHHLNILEKSDLVKWKLKDNKTKIFSLNDPKRPSGAVLIFDENDIEQHREEFYTFIESISTIEGKDIPYSEKIVRAEICFYYKWSED